jgi:enoyl-[acyl-carrier protein] reductase III
MIDLSNHVALVTGSSRGIGRACALRLAQAGADVVVNYISNRNQADEVAGTIMALGRRALVIKADASESEDVESLAGQVKEHFGRLDIIVSNAATGGFRPLLATTTRQFQAAMATNVEALLHLFKAFFPLLKASEKRAKVIAISSHGSQHALPMYGLVGMTKAALESLVRHAAMEFGPHNINVNVLLSGLVDTDAVRNIPDHDDLFARNQNRSLSGDRQLTPDDVADVAVFLASPLADMILGQTIIVDGGVGITMA